MSTTVDQRVVEMRFDNQHFERNVSTTMSTLDKLKQSLHLTGATKGLEDVNSAVKGVDMTGLGGAVDTVKTRFSALQVMGVTALANITNAAVNAGTRMVKALTIDPVKDGFNEYEMTLNAVQTTMSATGKTAEEVEEKLKVLDEYADKTVYSTADMLNNLPKFTNAGVDLEKATKAMIGIANATAHAGGDAGKASIAFYNLGQAIGTGYLTRMDYNSINNAGIATMEWKNQMVEAAIAQGTLTKVGEDAYQAGSKTLTLQQLFIDGLQEQWATTDVMMKVFGDYGDETTDIGKRAYSAAQDVKTFSMMMDSLKATAGTGWKDTWQIIFGGLDEAKEFWTGLSNFLGGILTKISDFRNNLLEGALDFTSPWSKITEKLDSAGLGKIKEVTKNITEAADKLKYFQDVVNDVWRGDYKTSDTGRFELLEKAGYDHRVVQDLVNKGYQYELTIEDIEASHKKFGLTMDKTTEETADLTNALNNLTDEQLKEAGLTDQEIALYKDLAAEADRTGRSISDLAEEMSTVDGRALIIDSLKNAGSGLIGIFTALKNAFIEIFPPPTVVQVYNLIKAFNTFSEKLRLTDKETGELTDTAKKLQRTFKGIFAALDIVATIAGGAFKVVFKAATQLLAMFGLDILDVTAYLGDAIVKFRDWIDASMDFTGVFEKIIPPIVEAVKAFRNWIKSLKESDNLTVDLAKGIGKGIGTAIKFVVDFVKSFGSKLAGGFSDISSDSVSGFVNGMWAGIKRIGSVLYTFASTIITTVCDVLGIESPSTEFYDIAMYCIQGAINGFKKFGSLIWGAVSGVFEGVMTGLSKFDLGKAFSAIISSGLVVAVLRISSALKSMAAPLEGVGDVLQETSKVIGSFKNIGKAVTKVVKTSSKVVKSFSKVLNGFAFSLKAEALKDIAIAIAIVLGSIVASITILTLLDQDKMNNAVKIMSGFAIGLGIFIGIIMHLSNQASAAGKAGKKMGESLEDSVAGAIDMGKIAALLLSMAAVFLAMAYVTKVAAGMEPDELKKAAGALAVFTGVVALLILSTKLAGSEINSVGGTILKISAAMVLLAMTMRIVGGMKPEAFKQGLNAIVWFMAIVVGLMLATQLVGSNAGAIGGTILKISAALLLFTAVTKMLGSMDPTVMEQGLGAIVVLTVIISTLIWATQLAGKDIDKVGGTILKVSGAILLLSLATRVLGSMAPEKALQGVIGVAALVGVIALLMLAIRKLGTDKELKGVGTTLLLMSVAIGILAAVAVLLGLINIEHLAKGIIAVGLLGGLMSLMIMATKNAKDCKGNLVVMTVAIAVMAGAIAALSFIKPKDLIAPVAAMSILMGMFALIIKMASNMNKSMGTLTMLTMVVGLMGYMLYKLSSLPTESVLGSASALILLMGTISGVFFILGKMRAPSLASIGALALIGLVVGEMAVILGLMSHFNVTPSMETIMSLSVLMIVMTGLLLVLSLVGANAMVGVGALALLGLVIGEMAVILGLINRFNLTPSMSTILSLTVLMGAMTALLLLLNFVGPTALVGVGALALLGLVVGEMALILGLMNHFDVNPSIETALSLSILLGAMSASLVILGLVGAMGASAFIGIAALATLIAAVGGVCVGIGALATEYPMLETFLDTGIPILEKIGYALGSFFGNVLGGFSAGISSGLPEIGTNLSLFMANVTPFIDGCKNVDASVLAGVGTLAASIIALTAADLIAGISSFIQGGSSFADLGTELSMFMTNAAPFIAGASLLSDDLMSGVKSLAEVILILTAADVLQGLTSWLTGGSSLSSFGEQLPGLGASIAGFVSNIGTFSEDQVATVGAAAGAIKELASAAQEIPNAGGLLADLVGDNEIGTWGAQLPLLGTCIAAFVANVGTFSEDQVTTVGAAAGAIKTLANAAKEIPNAGGLLADLVGDNEIATWGVQLPLLGTCIAAFVANVGTFSDDQVATVGCAADAIKTLANAAKEIPNAGGLLADLVGDNEIGTWGAQLPLLGTCMSQFVSNIGTFTPEQVTTASCAADAIGKLAEAATKIPNEGGWLSKLVGDNNIGTFGDHLAGLGSDLAAFVKNLGVFGTEQIYTVNAAVQAVHALAKLADSNLKDAKSNLEGFGDKIVSFGASIANFAGKLGKNSENINTAISNLKNIVDAVKAISDDDVDSLKTLGDSLKSVGEKAVKKFVDAFTSDSAKSDVKKAAGKLADKAVEGMEEKESDLEDAGDGLADAASGAINTTTNYTDFYNAGTYLVDGFAAGISEQTFEAEAKAAAMAKAAKAAAERALLIKSPSKVFYGIGSFAGQGFVNALGDYGEKSYAAGTDVAENAKTGLSDAIRKIKDFISSDIDAQPAIRPVLDLDDIKSKAGLIGELIGAGSSIGVLANVGAISSMMNASSQNGGNGDIISAIEALRKDLNNADRASYTINGITYDDNSVVAEAIQEIVRASKMGRRV